MIIRILLIFILITKTTFCMKNYDIEILQLQEALLLEEEEEEKEEEEEESCNMAEECCICLNKINNTILDIYPTNLFKCQHKTTIHRGCLWTTFIHPNFNKTCPLCRAEMNQSVKEIFEKEKEIMAALNKKDLTKFITVITTNQELFCPSYIMVHGKTITECISIIIPKRNQGAFKNVFTQSHPKKKFISCCCCLFPWL